VLYSGSAIYALLTLDLLWLRRERVKSYLLCLTARGIGVALKPAFFYVLVIVSEMYDFCLTFV
jgi:4-amino-4-deoxy-L-arabinose transferase-like glycosyltransferase